MGVFVGGTGVLVGVGVGVPHKLVLKLIVRFDPFNVTRSPIIRDLYEMFWPDSSTRPLSP